MGRPSKLTDVQWEAIDRGLVNFHPKLTEDHCKSIGVRLLTVPDGEAAATEMLRLMLQFGQLEKAWKLPRISRYRFEFSVNGGRIDLLLFHVDGGISIVETKASHSMSGMAAGIGQLCVYASLIRDALGENFSPAYVRRILAASIEPEKSLTIMEACKMAGVEFAHLPSYRYLQSVLELLRRRAA